MKLTEQSIIRAIESVAFFPLSSWVREDHLHREINNHLLEHGLNTISCDDLADFIEADGYQTFFDACGRTIWKGIGLLSDRGGEGIPVLENEYPIRFTLPRITNQTETDPWDFDLEEPKINIDDELDF